MLFTPRQPAPQPVLVLGKPIVVRDSGEPHRPNPAGGSTVEWRAAFYRGYMLNDPPPELNDAAAVKAITGVVRAGLDNLKRIAETGT